MRRPVPAGLRPLLSSLPSSVPETTRGRRHRIRPQYHAGCGGAMRSSTPGAARRGTGGERIDVPAPDGVLDCYLHTPGGTGRWPLVLLYMDAFGIRPALGRMA